MKIEKKNIFLTILLTVRTYSLVSLTNFVLLKETTSSLKSIKLYKYEFKISGRMCAAKKK